MINKLAMQIVGGAVVVGLIFGLALYARAAVAERNLARVNYELTLEANQTLVAQIEALDAQRRTAERLRLEAQQELEQIRRSTRATIDRQARELAQLGRDYETVKEYHSAIAPIEHIRWVCEQIDTCPED